MSNCLKCLNQLCSTKQKQKQTEPLSGRSRIGNIAIEMTCTYNSKDPRKNVNCPKYVKHVKHMFTAKAYQVRVNHSLWSYKVSIRW